MQNLIDMCNHILRFNDCYFETGTVTDTVREDALYLCSKHGDEFCIGFIARYLELQVKEFKNFS